MLTEDLRPSGHRAILRATAIVGGASAINIVIGLLRNKVAALLLGPAGMGIIGLLLSLVTTLSGLAGLGVANAAVRQIAHNEDGVAQALARKALHRLTLALALIGALATWLLRRQIASLVIGDQDAAWQVGWLAPAVALSIWSTGQIAVLNGLRRLRDIAGTQILGGLLGTALGIAALMMWGNKGILAYVVAAPLAMVAAGAWFVARAPQPVRLKVTPWREALPILRLGIPMMLGGIMLSAGALAIRALIGTRIGAVELGGFTAAWMLSVTYVGFVLQAMGTDYLPRLTSVIHDRKAACQSVNEQTEVAMLLALPVMVAMQATAPWVVWLLYSSEFSDAVRVLRWLIIADVMKIAGWSLGFVIVAQARAKIFLFVEVATLSVTLAVVTLLIEDIGIQVVGAGYCASYMFYIVVVSTLARKSIRWRPSPAAAGLTIAGLIMTISTGVIGAFAPIAGLFVGGILSVAVASYSIRRLVKLNAFPKKIERFVPKIFG